MGLVALEKGDSFSRVNATVNSYFDCLSLQLMESVDLDQEPLQWNASLTLSFSLIKMK